MISRPVPATIGGYIYEEIPVIPDCIVMFFGTVRSDIEAPLVSGDFVWLLFPESSLDEFLDSGSASNPSIVARHGLTSPLAIPITLPGKAANTDKLALATKTDTEVDTIWAAIAKIYTDMGSLVTWMTAHMHPTAAAGPPSVAAPPPTPVVAPTAPTTSVAAAELKAK